MRVTFGPRTGLRQMGFEIVLEFRYKPDHSGQPEIPWIFRVPLSPRSRGGNEDCNFSPRAGCVACIRRNPLCDRKVGGADIPWKYRPPSARSFPFSISFPSSSSVPSSCGIFAGVDPSRLEKSEILSRKKEDGRLSLRFHPVLCIHSPIQQKDSARGW